MFPDGMFFSFTILTVACNYLFIYFSHLMFFLGMSLRALWGMHPVRFVHGWFCTWKLPSEYCCVADRFHGGCEVIGSVSALKGLQICSRFSSSLASSQSIPKICCKKWKPNKKPWVLVTDLCLHSIDFIFPRLDQLVSCVRIHEMNQDSERRF